jgi:hypothetical protein
MIGASMYGRLDPEMVMAVQRSSGVSISRRSMLAAMPAGVFVAAGAGVVRAQPVAADPVSFYLGQVLALATLQAESIRRLRPFLATPAPQDVDWQATTSAEAGVIGAVASVLGAMEPPAELTASVGELRLASAAYQSAATAAQSAALGDTSALSTADAGLAEGGGHILLWLEALTAETANDWGDGLRTLTLGAAPAPVEDIELQPPADTVAEPVADDPGDGVPAGDQDAQADRIQRDRTSRQNQQNRQARTNREGRAN